MTEASRADKRLIYYVRETVVIIHTGCEAQWLTGRDRDE